MSQEGTEGMRSGLEAEGRCPLQEHGFVSSFTQDQELDFGDPCGTPSAQEVL